MKFPRSALAIFALAPVASAQAQDDFLPTGPNPAPGAEPSDLRVRAVPGTSGSLQLAFWASEGRVYYIQKSENLVSWECFPVIEVGHDAAVSYAFTSESPRIFIRLRHDPAAEADPYLLDPDGDGLDTAREFTLRTDPFSADTDRDGLPDKWEVDHDFDPRDPADAAADANGNGVSNLDEFLNGNDPRLLAYGGVKPTIQVVSGDGQTPISGRFMPLPVRVRVLRPDGSAWAGAPVHFHADPHEGFFSATADDASPLRRVLTLATDAEGYAQAWIKTP